MGYLHSTNSGMGRTYNTDSGGIPGQELDIGDQCNLGLG